MKATQISNRSFILKFDDGDTNYLINGRNTIYLCDTHMGPKSMELVKDYIKTQGWGGKEIIVFNSHCHYDHIWGNCAFENVKIISHETCRKRIIERGTYDLRRLKNMYNTEGIELNLPNITFKNKLEFEEDEVGFLYTPGHTDCSAICIDKRDSVIYVNDLVEYPLPHLGYEDWKEYVKTLEFIKNLSPRVMVSTHSGIVDMNLLNENIIYIKNLIQGQKMTFEDGVRIKVHSNNIKRRLILIYESKVKEILCDRLDYETYKKEYWKLLGIDCQDLEREYDLISSIAYEDIEQAFKTYIRQIKL